MPAPKKPAPDVMTFGPSEGKMALEFCWHERPGIELRTNDGRVMATNHHKHLRPKNPEVWATYFVPPVEIR